MAMGTEEEDLGGLLSRLFALVIAHPSDSHQILSYCFVEICT